MHGYDAADILAPGVVIMANRRGRRQLARREQPTSFLVPERVFHGLVRGLAILGLLVSAYLSYLHFSESSAVLCTEDSGCDVVRGSDYSTLWGIPVAVLGLVGYASILGISFSRLTPFRKGVSVYFLALAGVTFAAYLTYLEVAVIHAICPYCVVSALLMTGILVTLFLRRPLVSGLSMDSLRLYSGIVVMVVILGSIVAYQGNNDGGGIATPYQVSLAQHLNDSGVVMYGAFWCSACAEQKARFGSAFEYVNYVECDAQGKDGNPALCQAKGVKAFPTWEIGGNTYEGVQSLATLERLSEYTE